MKAISMQQFTHHNSSLIYYPQLWGLVTQICINGTDILYCDDNSLTHPWWAVRWWIPTMLPNPGQGNGILPRHGIARQSDQFTSIETHSWVMFELDRNQDKIHDDQYQIFPHDFVYHLTYAITGSECTITQAVTNPNESDSHLPMGMGLHPYFPTPLSVMQLINGNTQPVSIHHYNDYTAVIMNTWAFVLQYADYYLVCEFDGVYRWIWMWYPPWHDAVCIEPVTHDVWAYFDNPIMIASWDIITATTRITMCR